MPLPEQLTHLEEVGLLRLAEAHPETVYGFRHALIHAATYHAVLKSDRRTVHRLVGEVLEASAGPNPPTGLAARLAHHFAEAGEKARALGYYLQAAAAAAKVYANAEAGELFTAAWQLAQTLPVAQVPSTAWGPLCVGPGRVLELQGQHPAARTHYAAVLAYARQNALPPLELKALQCLAALLGNLTPLYEPVQGEQLALQALALARTLADADAESEELWCLMQIYIFTGRTELAEDYGQQALQRTPRAAHPERWALICNDLSRCYLGLGRPTQTLALLTTAYEVWQQLGALPMLADNLSRLSEAHYWLGHYPLSQHCAQEGLRLGQSLDNAWSQAVSGWMLAQGHWTRGATNAALQAYAQAVTVATHIQLNFVLSLLYSDLCAIYSVLGATAQSLEFAAQALACAATQANVIQRNVQAILGRVAVRRGALTEAPTHFAAARQELREDDFSSYAALNASLGEIELALAQGQPTHALSLSEKWVAISQRSQVRLGLAEALHRQAQAHCALGQWPAAYGLLQAAQAEAEATGARWALWSILADLSRVAATQHEPEVARLAHAQAQALVRALHATLPPDLQTTWAQQPHIAQLLNEPYTSATSIS